MIVDDNETIVEVLRELLRSAGYAVVTARGGREALSHLRSSRPDVVLLDLMMPEVSGEDVLRELRRDPALADLPVILLTARASREDRLVGLRMGADDYLAKPVDTGELLLRVRNTLARASLAHEKLQRDQHLEAARAVQEALLPLERNFPAVDVDDHYHAADQTGGDWFGYGYDPETNRMYVALGDVTGHGIPAALVTGAAAGAFRASLRLLSETHGPMSAALNRLSLAMNDAVVQTGARARRLMTMLFVCVDLQTGEGCYLNAGHGALYLFGGPRPRVLSTSGVPLGSERSPKHIVHEFRLQPGEGFFVHSDGLMENEGPDGRVLSPRKLQKLLSSVPEVSALKRLILREGQAVWRDRRPDDDCCFVLVQWRTAEAPTTSASAAG
jgi:CheY-like chemotaxis protein